MRDPGEGITEDGMIRTGAARANIHPAFASAIAEIAAELSDMTGAQQVAGGDVSVWLYGSVATGSAVVGESDIDLIAIGADSELTSQRSTVYSRRFHPLCRSVEIGPASPADFAGDSDEAYGNRVFLRHYCVPLSVGGAHGELRRVAPYAADRRAARGFNGDIARHRDRWRRLANDGVDRPLLLARIARKSLLAVAGLVSVHDTTWTTDRVGAARRWSELYPALAAGLSQMLSSVDPGGQPAGRADVVELALATADVIVDQFADSIGLWSNDHA